MEPVDQHLDGSAIPLEAPGFLDPRLPGRQRTLLLLDRSAQERLMLQVYLQVSLPGIRVLPVASHGQAATALHDRPVDMIIVHLQDGDGHARRLLETCGADYPRVPVIAVATPETRESVRELTGKVSLAGWLEDPPAPPTAVGLVHEVLARSKVQAREDALERAQALTEEFGDRRGFPA